ncbi:coiled-coil domain-containing protein 18-like [Pelobates fuscus]|uniref:coiled-coil domain-containing protein 18-like n=1 Tax=Pelobates fuscus TaxID=191477 RepID=UPI002FE4C800
MNMFHTSRCSSPMLYNSFMYSEQELDSGVPSLKSSASSSECYGSRYKADYWPMRYGLLEGALEHELFRSENRRSVLGDSLENALYALQHQRSCLHDQENDIMSNQSRLEHLLQRQQNLESRMHSLKQSDNFRNSFTPYTSEINEKKDWRFQTKLPSDSDCVNNSRINTLEREINNINQKMKTCAAVRTSNHSNGLSLCMKKQQELEEMQEELQLYTQQMVTRCRSAEQEKDSMDLEMVSLHAGLFQAKFASKGLEKECVKLHSQLLANRNINENLHLEVSSLKRHAQKLENTVKGSDSENKSLNLQLENMERERQQLLSQKEFLQSALKKGTKHQKSIMKRNERSDGQTLTLGNESKSLEEDTSKIQQLSRNVNHISEISPSSKATSRTSCRLKMYKVEKEPSLQSNEICSGSSEPCKSRSNEEIMTLEKKSESLHDDKNKERQIPENIHFISENSPMDSKSRTSTRRKRSKVRKNEEKVNTRKYEYLKLPDRKCTMEETDLEPPNSKKSLPVDKESCVPNKANYLESDIPCTSSKKSEINNGQSELLIEYCHHLSNLLQKLQRLLKSNARLGHEKDEALKYLLFILKKVKKSNILSEKSREQVEQLLNEHVSLTDNCHKRDSQITSVVIELKHLGKAYRSIVNHSENTDDRNSVLWIRRVQALQDSLNILKCQKEKTESIEKDICLLKKEKLPELREVQNIST